MSRTMMQMYVKKSVEAVLLYQKAFGAKILCEYKNDDGSYMHAELDVFDQVVAISESYIKSIAGNTMQFCFHLGKENSEKIKYAYEVLKEDAKILTPIGPCSYSKCMFSLIDIYGVNWCLFE